MRPASCQMRFLWIGKTILTLLCVQVLSAENSSVSDLSSLLSAIPHCGQACLVNAIVGSTCSVEDQGCICRDDSLQQQATFCVLSTCSVKHALLTRNVTDDICHRPVRDRSHVVYSMNVAVGVIDAFFVLLRLGTRVHVGIGLGMDDWATLAIMFLGASTVVISCFYLIPSGLGKDIWTLSPDQITHFFVFVYYNQAVYFLMIQGTKLVFLFFFLRIFPGSRTRTGIWAAVTVNCMLGVALFLASIFGCSPIDYYWRQWDGEQHGQCINLSQLTLTGAAITVAMDVWMLAIPLWEIRKLNMNIRKKSQAMILFGLGIFITIVSIIRLQSIQRYSLKTSNPTWDFCDIYVWSEVEIGLSLVITCLPTLKLLTVKKMKHNDKHSSNFSDVYQGSEKGKHRHTSTADDCRDVDAHSVAKLELSTAGNSPISVEDEEEFMVKEGQRVIVNYVEPRASPDGNSCHDEQ